MTMFSAMERTAIFRIIAGVLHLGNIDFDVDAGGDYATGVTASSQHGPLPRPLRPFPAQPFSLAPATFSRPLQPFPARPVSLAPATFPRPLDLSPPTPFRSHPRTPARSHPPGSHAASRSVTVHTALEAAAAIFGVQADVLQSPLITRFAFIRGESISSPVDRSKVRRTPLRRCARATRHGLTYRDAVFVRFPSRHWTHAMLLQRPFTAACSCTSSGSSTPPSASPAAASASLASSTFSALRTLRYTQRPETEAGAQAQPEARTKAGAEARAKTGAQAGEYAREEAGDEAGRGGGSDRGP